MTTDPWMLLEDAATVLAVHAHPDDESLSTGALLASLAGAGTRVELLTATRGEEGEVVPGSVPPEDTRPLELVREAEIDAATSILGIAARCMLGTAPALAAGVAPRTYRDSGMQWIREGLAGPSDTAGADSFTHRPLEEAVDDLVALIQERRPDAVIGYDDEGTYGHPDHVRAHHVTAAACARTGTPMIEVSSAPDPAADAGFTWRDHPRVADIVRRAVDSYRTQLTVVGWADEEQSAGGTESAGGIKSTTAGENKSTTAGEKTGISIRHVGGQDDVVLLRTGLRVRG